jgi:PIN domain nuclease of toxin-antitoxin system
MKYLVDTHVLLWSLFEPERLPQKLKAILLDESNDIYYSAVNIWEISIKFGLDKLSLGELEPDDFLEELLESFYLYRELEPFVVAAVHRLPSHHKDPFDRLMICDAIHGGLTLLSLDERLKAYEPDGLLLAI